MHGKGEVFAAEKVKKQWGSCGQGGRRPGRAD